MPPPTAALRLFAESIVPTLERIGFPCYLLDRAGTVAWVNVCAADLAGGDPVGRHFLDFVPPEHAELAREVFERKLRGEADATTFEIDVVTLDGRRISGRVSSVVLREGGRAVAVFGIASPSTGAAASPARVAPRLTARQADVLALLGRGMSTREIAAELGIAGDTARNHIRSLLRELGAHTRLEAVVKAHRIGLLRPTGQ